MQPFQLTTEFMPAALDRLPKPPVFTLRAGTRRQRASFQTELMKLPVRPVDPIEIRTELLAGARANAETDGLPGMAAFLVEEFDRLDREGKPGFEARMANFAGTIARLHTPLRELMEAQQRYEAVSDALALSMTLASWTGLEAPLRVVAGEVPFATIAEVGTELARIEADADLPQGTAYAELVAAGRDQLFGATEPELTPEPMGAA